jgi:hypothetical protein
MAHEWLALLEAEFKEKAILGALDGMVDTIYDFRNFM